MRKVYRKLTADQKSRDVIFSSQLIGKTGTSVDSGIIHEVIAGEDGGDEKIARLLDDKFFNDSPYSYNLIRQ